MHKFKCTNESCGHSAEEKGFCPKCGKALESMDAANTDEKSIEDVLAKVKTIVHDAMKEYEVSGNKAVHTDKMPVNLAERHEYVKGLLTDNDKAALEALPQEKQEKFLGKAAGAYFFKSLVAYQISKDPAQLQNVKALAQGVDADGGYLVPTEFRAQLVQDLMDASFLRSLVTVIPMSTNSMELPTTLTNVKTSWGSENTAISTTTLSFGTLTFAPKRLNTMIYASRELVNDSALPVIQLITKLFREAIGREEDRVIVNGNGTTQPKGILQETLSGIDNANDDSTLAVNLKALPFRLGTMYRKNGKWLMNSISLAAVATLKAAATGEFLYKEGIEGLTPHRLAGYEVHEQNDMPLETIVFGDFSQYFLADREQISVETTTEGAGAFEKHQVAIKVVERIDGKVAQVNAFRALTNAGID